MQGWREVVAVRAHLHAERCQRGHVWVTVEGAEECKGRWWKWQLL
jgi:hypothetical protein